MFTVLFIAHGLNIGNICKLLVTVKIFIKHKACKQLLKLWTITYFFTIQKTHILAYELKSTLNRFFGGRSNISKYKLPQNDLILMFCLVEKLHKLDVAIVLQHKMAFVQSKKSQLPLFFYQTKIIYKICSNFFVVLYLPLELLTFQGKRYTKTWYNHVKLCN